MAPLRFSFSLETSFSFENFNPREKSVFGPSGNQVHRDRAVFDIAFVNIHRRSVSEMASISGIPLSTKILHT